MRKIACLLAPLLLLGACVPDVDIARDTTLSGRVTAKTFRVRPGVVVSVDDDLAVDSQGPAVVEGVLRGEIGSGASIEIRVSTGDCVVAGGLEAGSGADGEEPGADGEAGGDVRLRADRGRILVRGPLAAGEGGDGAGRQEQGRGDLRVASGAGGAGGDVELLGESVVLATGAAAGDGGAGGAAFAQNLELAPGASNIVARGEPLAGEEENGFGDSPPPAAGSALALSRAGGNGGSVVVQAGPGGIFLAPGATLRAGDGGNTARASASGGRDASAALDKPGAGGDVALRWSGPAPAAAGWSLIPGEGGDAGALGAISCVARAHGSAAAKTAGGGEPGKLFLGGAPVKTAAGGDSGNVLARTDRDAKSDLGDAGRPGTAGKPAAAQQP